MTPKATISFRNGRTSPGRITDAAMKKNASHVITTDSFLIDGITSP